ncbi:RNA polymerase sigma factor RpoH [Pelagibacteraceae bacterium]|jgi:RNA polymerase sigma-32 factor|nr:RNA polymerase sigma factor RpoH [Pelagibacteraceae bacterium]MDB3873258.1 RNA polymerase sigma factor RpoH [Pelagibacteraceae bacterium]
MSDKLEKQNLPVLSPDGSFNTYLQKIRKFPMLDAAEEYILAKNWRDKGDKESAHKLVTSHLRLVAKIATGYRGYGLPMSELVSEGNIGLMTAVKKFDPEKGFRLATYAMWWIKASMQEYILRSWSLVKIGTTAAQKKLFFNLRKMKNQIMRSDQSDLLPDQVTEIANRLDVTEDEVSSMEQRMKGPEKSLNATISDENGDSEWQDWVVDENADQELQIAHRQETTKRKALLDKAMSILNEREKEILFDRRLNEEPKTLEELSQKYNISRERIRQIENRAFEKLQKEMLEQAKDQKLISVN